MGKINPLIGVGVPTWGRVTTTWARTAGALGGPLGSSRTSFEVKGKPIDIARNELMQTAINVGCDYLFMLGDDVLPPGDTIIKMWHTMQDRPDIDLLTGVYWTKAHPTAPYLWKGMQRGPYLDWVMGEMFPVDFAGCDCLLIRLSQRVKDLGPRWFALDWVWGNGDPGEKPDLGLNTEDFYFYTRAREAGITLWADTGIQCLHEDRTTDMLYGLLENMPQAGGAGGPWLPEPGTDDERVVVADIGCGKDTPYFGEPGKVKILRIDGTAELKPDVRCDLRNIPLPDGCVDMVHSRHALEHFPRADVLRVLNEWLRILRVGGELRLCVPNIIWAFQRIMEMEAGIAEPDPVPFWVLWGRHDDDYDFHRNGFTVKRLRLLLERVGTLDGIEVSEGDGGFNLYATATKIKNPEPYALVPAWERIAEIEGRCIEGINVEKPSGVVYKRGKPTDMNGWDFGDAPPACAQAGDTEPGSD